MSRIGKLVVVALFVIFVSRSSWSVSVLVPFGSPMYLPFSFPEKVFYIIPATKKQADDLSLLINKKHPDILVISTISGLSMIKSGKMSGYIPSHIVLWRSGTLVVPVDNLSFDRVLVGCKNNYWLLSFYREKSATQFQIVMMPYLNIFKLVFGGYKGAFVEVEPFTSYIFQLFPGKFIPFVDLSSFFAATSGIKFPVKGVPLAAIFVKKNSMEVKKALELLINTARKLNKFPEKFSPQISKNISAYFHVNFPTEVIEDSLASKRVYFWPVPYDKIEKELQKYVTWWKNFH